MNNDSQKVFLFPQHNFNEVAKIVDFLDKMNPVNSKPKYNALNEFFILMKTKDILTFYRHPDKRDIFRPINTDFVRFHN